MIVVALAGLGLALSGGRKLLAVVLAVVVPLLMILFALDITALGRTAPIINGDFVFVSGGGGLAVLELALAVVCWLLAVTAGTVVLIADTSPVAAFGMALKKLPGLAVGLAVFAAVDLGAFQVLAKAAAAVGGILGVWILLAALALVLCRFVFAIATMVFGGSTWMLTRGKVFSTSGAFLLGGVALPFGLAAMVGSLPFHATLPLVSKVVDVVLLTATVALQSGIIAHVYLWRTREEEWIEAESGLGEASVASRGGRVGRWVGIVAVVLAPALLAGGVAAANPYGAPTIQARTNGPAGGAMAVAWPAGQMPIIVGSSGGMWFCEDELCSAFVQRNGDPSVMHGHGTVDISPDGVVTKAVLTGGEENGGPFIHYGRCTKADPCRQAWLPARASADEPFVWSALAVTSTKEGVLYFALAVPPPIGATGPVQTEFKLIRCDDFECAKPHRFTLGAAPSQPRTGDGPFRFGRLTVDSQGRPTATFEVDRVLYTADCAPVTCAEPSLTKQDAWVKTPDLVTVEPSGAPGGLHLYIGRKPEYWRYQLRCAGTYLPLDVVKGDKHPAMAAVSADARVLVVRQDRIMLVTPPR